MHPSIYAIYDLIDLVPDPRLAQQIREHVVCIEGRIAPLPSQFISLMVQCVFCLNGILSLCFDHNLQILRISEGLQFAHFLALFSFAAEFFEVYADLGNLIVYINVLIWVIFRRYIQS